MHKIAELIYHILRNLHYSECSVQYKYNSMNIIHKNCFQWEYTITIENK